jgi:thymidine kinase
MECGKLELIIGNMFSGKSTELIRRINREKSINKKIIVVNFAGDNRYSTDSISTHNGNKIKCLKLSKLSDIPNGMIKDYDSFFIDEGQFFPDLFEYITLLVDTHRKHVVVSGLSGDYSRNNFGDIYRLIPICDTLDKLSAYCKSCNNGTYAPFSKRITSGNSIVDVGGNDKYIPVCRFHYFS